MTTTGMEQPPSAQSPYPVRLEVSRPAQQSRLLNLPLGIGLVIRAILLIPHFIILYFLGLVAVLLYLIASVAILFTGRYPKGLYDFIAGYMRWNENATVYLASLYDVYPPFTTEQRLTEVRFETDYPEGSSRLLNFPIVGIYIKEIILIPHLIVIAFLGLAAFLVIFVAKFAILFSGSFPEGMHRFVTGVLRWALRLQCYIFGLTDRYPPFSLN